MRFTLKQCIYESVPLWIKQSVRLVPFSWIAGRAYRRSFGRDGLLDFVSRQEVLAYQEKALGEMLQFVVEQVPAYRHLRSKVERFKPFDALKFFPEIDKNIIQNNMQQYLPRDFAKIPHYEISTGGTSGNQLKLYVDDGSQATEMGFVHRFWERMGYYPHHKKATFRGISFPNLKQGIYWQYNPIFNELQFSPFHMNNNTLPVYVEQLIRYSPRYLHGYPSAIDLLSEFILREKLQSRLPEIKAVFLVSEGCYQSQRERIESAFRTRVFSWYGHSERLIFGGECEKNSTYHHFPDYGILEIITDDGNICQNEGDYGEIVGTGLLNKSLPLIRYRTGDYARLLAPECQCGRNWDRFTNVLGRWKQDMVIGNAGARISIAALNMHWSMFENVTRYQYYQDKAGICEIRLMVNEKFTDKDELAIKKAYLEKVSGELKIITRIVDNIPLTARGKLKLLDSKLSLSSENNKNVTAYRVNSA